MRQSTIKWLVYAILAVALTVACASTELTDTRVDESRRGKPVSDILVIVVTDDEENRRSFEGKFVAQLKAAGVEAVSSVDGIPIPADQKLEEDVILKAVEEFKNDAVIITHLVGVEEKEVYTPPARSYRSYYGYYDYAYDSFHDPGYYSTHTFVRLETNLYDVETEKLIWSGKSETWNPGSTKQVIDEVIEVVIKDLQNKKLLPPK